MRSRSKGSVSTVSWQLEASEVLPQSQSQPGLRSPKVLGMPPSPVDNALFLFAVPESVPLRPAISSVSLISSDPKNAVLRTRVSESAEALLPFLQPGTLSREKEQSILVRTSSMPSLRPGCRLYSYHGMQISIPFFLLLPRSVEIK